MSRPIIVLAAVVLLAAGIVGVVVLSWPAHLAPAPDAEAAALEPRVRRAVAERFAATQAAPRDVGARVLYAMVLHSNALHGPAAEAYAQCLVLEPDRAGWRYLRALALDDLGRADEARAEHLRAAADLPNDAAVQARLGFRHLDRNDAGAAAEAFAQAARADPGHLPTRIGTARLALATDRAAEARAALDALLETNPRERYARYLRGLARRALGDDEGARRDLEMGAGSRLNWRGHDPHVDRLRQHRAGYEATLEQAAARIARGEPELAVGLLEALLRERPDDLPATMVLADAHRAAGRVDQAIELLEAALTTEGDHYATELNLARLHELNGDAERGLPHALRAVDLNPTFARARVQAARLLLRLRRPAEAEAQAREAATLTPDSLEGLTLLGLALREQGRTADAAATFTLLIERRPDRADGAFHLASLHAAAGRTAVARELLETAQRRFPGDARLPAALQALERAP